MSSDLDRPWMVADCTQRHRPGLATPTIARKRAGIAAGRRRGMRPPIGCRVVDATRAKPEPPAEALVVIKTRNRLPGGVG